MDLLRMLIVVNKANPTIRPRRAPSLVFLSVFDGIVLSIELTRLLGYYWLSGKLIGTLHIHASHTWLLLHLLQ